MSCAHAGSTPTTRARGSIACASRATWPSPVPTSSTSRGTREVLGGQRQDLLGVLGVGPLGERVLPPACVHLPGVADLGGRAHGPCTFSWIARGHRVGQPGSACSSSSEARFIAADTAELLHQALLARRARDRGCRRARSSSCAGRAACGGRRWRSGGPRRGCAAGGRAPPTAAAMRIGSAWPGTYTSSKRLASAATEISSSRPKSSTTFMATPSWPLPPSTSSRFGGYENLRRRASPGGRSRSAWSAASRRVSTSSIAAKSSLPGDRAHLEAAVVALLRERVLHDDHRPDVVGALDVAHVVALDPQRGVGQVERLLQRVDAPAPGRCGRRTA